MPMGRGRLMRPELSPRFFCTSCWVRVPMKHPSPSSRPLLKRVDSRRGVWFLKPNGHHSILKVSHIVRNPYVKRQNWPIIRPHSVVRPRGIGESTSEYCSCASGLSLAPGLTRKFADVHSSQSTAQPPTCLSLGLARNHCLKFGASY